MTMKREQNKISYGTLLTDQLMQAQQKNIPSVLIAKGSPYLLHPYIDLASSVLVNFDDHIYQKIDEQSGKEQAYSSGYITSMAIIFGEQKVRGKLPVTLR